MKPTEKQQAKDLYFQLNLPQTKIAEILNIERKTVSRWMEEDKWRDMKYAAQQMPGLILQDLYNQLACLHARIHSPKRERQYPTDEESIIQRRLMMSIKNAEKQSVGNYMQIMTELIQEIAKESPQLAHQLAPYTDKILKKKLDKKTFRKNAMFLTEEPYEEVQQEQPEEGPCPSAPESAPISGNHLALEPENESSPLGPPPDRDGLPLDRDGEKEGLNACMPDRNVPPCDISENLIAAPTNDFSPQVPENEKNISETPAHLPDSQAYQIDPNKNNCQIDYQSMPELLRRAWQHWWKNKPARYNEQEIMRRATTKQFPPPLPKGRYL